MNKVNLFPNVSLMQWSSFYRITSILSVLMLLIIPLQVIIFTVSPPPASVEGFFTLFRQNTFLGLLDLDFLYLFNNIFLVFIYLALFLKLFRDKPSLCLAALILGLVGITCYYSSNPAFEMLTLSTNYYHAAAAEQGYFIAAGEALMAGYTGTSFNVYYITNAAALLMFAAAILKTAHFSKATGIWGIVSGILMCMPSSAGQVGMVFALLSLIP